MAGGIKLDVKIEGDRAAGLRFETFPTYAHDRLLTSLQNIERRLEAAVRSAVPRKSGELQQLIGGRVYDHKTRIAAVVGLGSKDPTEIKKTLSLEFGSRGKSVTLRAHGMRLAHFWDTQVTERIVRIPSHSRIPNIMARRFMRDPFQAMRSSALAEMEAAVEQAKKDAGLDA